MTAQELADRFVNDPAKGATKLRVEKLQAACRRLNVTYLEVLALLPAEIYQQIKELP